MGGCVCPASIREGVFLLGWGVGDLYSVFSLDLCCDLSVLVTPVSPPPPDCYVENLKPEEVVLGGGPLGRDSVMRAGPS